MAFKMRKPNPKGSALKQTKDMEETQKEINRPDSPVEHKMDAWGFKHGHKNHRSEETQEKETAIPVDSGDKKSPNKQWYKGIVEGGKKLAEKEIQKYKDMYDEASQIGMGLKGTWDELSGVTTGGSDPVDAFKAAYAKEEAADEKAKQDKELARTLSSNLKTDSPVGPPEGVKSAKLVEAMKALQGK